KKLMLKVTDAAQEIDKPLVFCSMNSHSLDEWQGKYLTEHQKQIGFAQGVGKTLKAIQKLLDYSRFVESKAGAPAAAAASAGSDGRKEKALELLRKIDRNVLTEAESKQLLTIYGIPTTLERNAKTPEEAVEAAEAIGYPVVMKIDSPDILHKTEAGGVK